MEERMEEEVERRRESMPLLPFSRLNSFFTTSSLAGAISKTEQCVLSFQSHGPEWSVLECF